MPAVPFAKRNSSKLIGPQNKMPLSIVFSVAAYKTREACMHVSIPAVVAALAVAGPAAAFEGSYQGGYDGQTLEIKKTGPKSYALSFTVALEGCAGGVDLNGTAKGKTLVAMAKEDDNVCTITVKKTAHGLSVAEDGCLYYHGASCDFEGKYTKK
jgi:hypothetical protein